MPKQLINLLGVLVTIAIVGLAIGLVALPIYLQSLETSAQTAQVSQTNSTYQTQIDSLRAEEQRMDEIQASVNELRTQIPGANDLDDVFELVAQAASSAGATVQTITAGDSAAFVVRTEPSAVGEEAAEDAPAPVEGSQQVDFRITVAADDISQAVDFLDNLRRGPRLLSTIDSAITPAGEGYQVSVSALTFVLPEA